MNLLKEILQSNRQSIMRKSFEVLKSKNEVKADHITDLLINTALENVDEANHTMVL